MRGELLVFRQPLVPQPVWVSISAAPLRLPDGTLLGAVVIITDITQLHELEEQQKIFLHMISHDLRSPMTIISGHAQLVEDTIRKTGVDGIIRQSMDVIRRSIQDMVGMIQDLVDAARAEGGQLELKRQPVDLHTYLDDLLKRSAAIIAIDRIQLEVPDDLPAVYADESRLERVVTNLLSNALKYSDPGTPVLVRARRTDAEVEIAITDQGRGIAPEELPRLFQRFYRARETRGVEGIGLGLYITNNWSKRMADGSGSRAKLARGAYSHLPYRSCRGEGTILVPYGG